MRVFGRRGRIDVRWERTCPDRAPTRLDSVGLNQAPHVVGRWVRQARDATGLGGCGHDVGRRTSAAAPSTLDRVGGVEDKGTGHPGKRQVERHVDEDRKDEWPALSHGANSSSKPPLGQADEHQRDGEHGYTDTDQALVRCASFEETGRRGYVSPGRDPTQRCLRRANQCLW